MKIKTKLGMFDVEFSERGVKSLHFGSRGQETNPTGRSRRSATLQRQLRQYASGKNVRWSVPLDLSAGTAFQQAVWRALCRIPYGETRSYAWVAQQIKRPRATRAVGAACGANPVPVIVPCHRVIASNGSLGGFSCGLAWKKRLLGLEKSAMLSPHPRR